MNDRPTVTHEITDEDRAAADRALFAGHADRSVPGGPIEVSERVAWAISRARAAERRELLGEVFGGWADPDNDATEADRAQAARMLAAIAVDPLSMGELLLAGLVEHRLAAQAELERAADEAHESGYREGLDDAAAETRR